MKLEFHPLLKNVPMMSLRERDELASDINTNGQIFPILIFQGKIIDGRNRYLACLARGIEPKIVECGKTNAKDFVASVNYFRKHWTTAERAHFAALMSLESEAGNPETKTDSPLISSNELITQAEAAKTMGVSVASVKRAKAKIKGKLPKQSSNGEIVDGKGYPIPKKAMLFWNRKQEVQDILTHISKARSALEKIEDGDPLYRRVNSIRSKQEKLKDFYNEFKGALPEYVCYSCDGLVPATCRLCGGTGVVSEFEWKSKADPAGHMRREQAIKKLKLNQPF